MTIMVHTQSFKIQCIEQKKDQSPTEDKNVFWAFTKSNYFYVTGADLNEVIKQELPHKPLQFHHKQNASTTGKYISIQFILTGNRL